MTMKGNVTFKLCDNNKKKMTLSVTSDAVSNH